MFHMDTGFFPAETDPTMWSSPMRYCSSISLASVEWPTSSKLSVASAPACSNKTSSPPGCWTQRINNKKIKIKYIFFKGGTMRTQNYTCKTSVLHFAIQFIICCFIILLYSSIVVDVTHVRLYLYWCPSGFVCKGPTWLAPTVAGC